MHSNETRSAQIDSVAVAAAARPRGSPIRLADLLAGSKWSKRTSPFPHIYVHQVFVAPVYDQLSAAFGEILARSAPDRRHASGLVYFGDTFDAYLMPFRPSFTGALSLFISRAWVDLLAKVTGVDATYDVNGALHYHQTGSKDGFIHKDFSSCWFIDNPRPDGVNVSDNNLCNYRSGKTSVAGATPQERIRAVAMLFYLNNARWSAGDGGETGLYRTGHDPIDKPAIVIPPINNSMLIFECSPHSYHSFISNRHNPRSSVALWLHRKKADAVAKWGGESIVYVPG
jgi:hypothetical protein